MRAKGDRYEERTDVDEKKDGGKIERLKEQRVKEKREGIRKRKMEREDCGYVYAHTYTHIHIYIYSL